MNNFADIHSSIIMTSYGLGLLGILGGVFAFLRYTSYNETVKLQNDNIKALMDRDDIRGKELQGLKDHNLKLEARLEVVESIPLKKIEKHMDTTNKILAKILEKE